MCNNLSKNQKKKLKRKAKRGNTNNQIDSGKTRSFIDSSDVHEKVEKLCEPISKNRLNDHHLKFEDVISPNTLSLSLLIENTALKIDERMEVEKLESDLRKHLLQMVLYGNTTALVESFDNITLICVDRFARIQTMSSHMVVCTCTRLCMITLNITTFSTLALKKIQIVSTYLAMALEDSLKERKGIVGMSFG